MLPLEFCVFITRSNNNKKFTNVQPSIDIFGVPFAQPRKTMRITFISRMYTYLHTHTERHTTYRLNVQFENRKMKVKPIRQLKDIIQWSTTSFDKTAVNERLSASIFFIINFDGFAKGRALSDLCGLLIHSPRRHWQKYSLRGDCGF